MKKILLKKSIYLVLVFLLAFTTFGSEIIFNKVPEPEKVEIGENEDLFKDVVFVGDSYAYYIGEDFGPYIKKFELPGTEVSGLSGCVDYAILEKPKYIIFFIGPNDQFKNVNPADFSMTLLSYINKIKASCDAKILFCSYLDTMIAEMCVYSLKYTAYDYDLQIQKLCDSNEKVYYINLWNIFNLQEHRGVPINGIPDVVHYNSDFNKKVVNKIKEFIKNDSFSEISKNTSNVINNIKKK